MAGVGRVWHSREGKRLQRDLPKSVTSPDADASSQMCRNSLGKINSPYLFVISSATSRSSHEGRTSL